VNFDEQQIEQLKSYLVLLNKWNKTHNLTAITDIQQMIDLHILDSLSVLSARKKNPVSAISCGNIRFK